MQRRDFHKLAIAAAATFTALSAHAEPGISDKEIRLGGILPLQSGLSAGATQYRDGLDSYFKWVNANGGIHGRKIVWGAENDSYNPQQAVAAVKKLVDRDEVFAIVGTLGTTNTLAMLPFLKQRGVPLLGPLGSHPSINEPEDRNVFPMSPLGPLHGRSLAQFANENLKAKKIAVFYQDDQYGKELLAGARKYAADNGMTVVGEAVYVPSDVDVSAQVLALSKTQPDAVLMAVIPKQGALFLQGAQRIGFKSAFLAPQLMADPVALQLAGDAINGLYMNVYVAHESMTTPAVKEAREILAKYAPQTPPGYWAFAGMSGAKMFHLAALKVGKDLTREKLMAQLNATGRFPTGLVPPVSYTEARRSGPESFGYARWEAGKVTMIKTWAE